jgi:hypothetical protein
MRISVRMSRHRRLSMRPVDWLVCGVLVLPFWTIVTLLVLPFKLVAAIARQSSQRPARPATPRIAPARLRRRAA